ncbi:bifunctional ADP-dependent (S)-NAD(P)H-hydrate dehydratase/NAD(P)H-hydrate epimerase [Rhizobium rhizosphaerae]|uniref:Bifunctional NAD(P)H-hydrate repair enzyme n=1 Tax=Xaviernesmea rhizosphaerae TaxID=1672749 RepID=A0A1Q9AGB9_9HYPH|nr:bifunctional ADP-dependent NAD(P)H-hydrate dehydratase/NAD(P)H-hydrate epimerase [Xaviernesmea rhizosphaerae]OLP53919.1 bifunctional ADP-dependent (S)-NAD(P)H-hydrate dehydratase/NAD(P)H-hydrate epimerase [Xaviernesmea rhizosphaerae]
MRTPLSTLLLSPEAMTAVDRESAESGIDSYGLMVRAGRSVAAAALKYHPGALRFVVLCGPGNNGGDGFVAARALAESGATVAVHLMGEAQRLKGDAARAHADWIQTALQRPDEQMVALSNYRPQAGDVVIDAVFGAGLSRPVPDSLAQIIKAVEEAGLPVLSIDLPSGIDGHSGAVLGAAFQAERSITFMTRKPGHLLVPGRARTGTLEVVDIGIPERIVRAAAGPVQENGPLLWHEQAGALDAATHKYKRGHLIVFSGNALTTGAARMSALAGLHSGAGLVTIAAPEAALAANAAHLTAIMLRKIEDAEALAGFLEDRRANSFVLGPGFGDLSKARDYVPLLAQRNLVLDADGITAFKDTPPLLFNAFAQGETRLVLTPHEGEFARLFPDLSADDSLSKVDKAIQAARRAHASIIYKGPDTVIAAPDGRAAINAHAPPWLATAGSGDVLAGIVGAHLAQGMPAFEAAAAAVWRHGDAGFRAGPSLSAETLTHHIHPLSQA